MVLPPIGLTTHYPKVHLPKWVYCPWHYGNCWASLPGPWKRVQWGPALNAHAGYLNKNSVTYNFVFPFNSHVWLNTLFTKDILRNLGSHLLILLWFYLERMSQSWTLLHFWLYVYDQFLFNRNMIHPLLSLLREI